MSASACTCVLPRELLIQNAKWTYSLQRLRHQQPVPQPMYCHLPVMKKWNYRIRRLLHHTHDIAESVELQIFLITCLQAWQGTLNKGIIAINAVLQADLWSSYSSSQKSYRHNAVHTVYVLLPQADCSGQQQNIPQNWLPTSLYMWCKTEIVEKFVLI